MPTPDRKRFIETSDYLREIYQANKLFDERASFQSISEHDVEALKLNGNKAENWKQIKILPGNKVDTLRISNCIFEGTVVIGNLGGGISVEGIPLKCGLYNSTIKDCVIYGNCLISNTSLLCNTVLLDSSAVLGCGIISSSGKTSFGNGISIPVGVEIGGRDVLSYAEISFDEAVAAASNRDQKSMQEKFINAVQKYVQHATSKINIISKHAQVLNCHRARDVYLGSHGVIDGGDIENVTILSLPNEKSWVKGGCFLRDVLVQWGSSADSMAVIQNSVLCEHSHVDRHGKLLDSILGPNSGISEGECTASLVGPFVGFHHQALLIACFWPSGKGNIGYGANVGSNHTLKAPDQELWPGEGVFFGLGVCVKYPSNFVNAPYSVIATGVSTLPQVLEMPFSLINIPGQSIPGISPAFNEISPGWVLAHCIFTVLRNEEKFFKRNKASRCHIEHEVFRPIIIDTMIEARRRLKAATPPKLRDAKGKGIYTEREIKGIGKNYMTEANLDVAVEAYSFYIRYYALRGLYRQLENGAPLATALSARSTSYVGSLERWNHERDILLEEFPGEDAKSLLAIFVKAQKTVAKSAEVGKSRDDKRGVAVIPDYNLVHKPASKEPIVISAKRYAEDIERAVGEMLSRL